MKLLAHFLLGVLVGLFVLAVVFSVFALSLQRQYRGKVLPNVYVFSTNISGKTKEELDQILSEKNNELAKQKITFYRNGQGKGWEIEPATIDFGFDIETMEKRLLTVGRKKTGLAGYFEIFQPLFYLSEIGPVFNYNQGKLDSWLQKIAVEVDVPAKDALLEYKNGRVESFQASKEGLIVDGEKMKPLIIDNFSHFPPTNALLTFDLPLNTVEPLVTTSETNNLGIIELLAIGESSFKDSIPSRVYNIGLAASRLHGIVIAPGQIFSFAEKIGDISAETGYQKAYVIKDNQTLLEDGGGVCQVSTTMFRAALYAGLPIVERQAHYYRVGFYEQGGFPPGMDATVYPPSPDLKFKNDTPAYILIQAIMDTGTKKLKFEIYGTNDKRKTQIDKPIIHSQTPPPPDLYTDDPTLAVGVVKRFDVAHWGAQVSFTRKVFNADGTLKEERTFWSNYKAWPAVYLRGTKI